MSATTIVMTDTGPIGLVLPHPDQSDLSENERAWIGFIRAISDHSDPPPRLAAVQSLRRVLASHG